MSESMPPTPLWTAGEIETAVEVQIRHPFNPASQVFLKPLSQLAGLKRAIMTVGRVPPGRESFVYHSHERDEEWLFILSGRGRAEIGDAVHEVGPGDFMGFPAPGPAHHLINTGDEDLVYLMGGERSGLEVATFPRVGKRVVHTASGIFAVDDAAAQAMTFGDFVKEGDVSTKLYGRPC